MNESIINEIKFLPPLPESIMEVNRLCADPESSLMDLVNVVKKDPIATATLLKVANSSLYGAREVKTIDRAVGMFGKAVTKSFLVNNAVLNCFELDLSPYGITNDDFSATSQKRALLMSKWYGEIDESMLDVLSTAAQVGNIGEVIVAREITKAGGADEFKESILDGEPLDELEIKYAGYTSTEVTAMVLEHWKLDTTLIDSIKYSTDIEALKSAPEHIKAHAMANFIVYNAINPIGDVSEEMMGDVEDLLEEHNLNRGRFIYLLEDILACDIDAE
jgi:HD-like signal output (HDOD) protein